MRSPVKRAVRRTVRAGQNVIAQIVVSVTAAVCVAFITNYLIAGPVPAEAPTAEMDGAAREAPPTDGPAAVPDATVAMPATTLPPLASEIIADLSVHDTDVRTEAEIFPGVPAEGPIAKAVSPSAAIAASANEQRRERRHFLGLPLPYFGPAAS